MNGELHILILEDRPTDAELAMRELRKAGLRFVANCVATKADFLANLRDRPPDLILADYSLPGFDGLSALAFVQKECPHIPFIFVSGTLGEETAIEALRHGATDYVLKQRLSRLVPAVERALRETEDRAQRQQAEAALLASERSYHEIFNAANDAIFLHDATSGAILDVNQTALDMFGYAREELLNLPGDEFRTDTAFSRHEAVRRIRQAAAVGPQVFEWQSKKKNGELFWTEVALRAAQIGGQQRVLAIVRDITERKRGETALTESRGLLKAILDNIPDPAWLKDLEGRFLACNEPLAQLFGRKVKNILGKTVFETAPPEAERLASEDQTAIASRRPIRVERPFTDARGQRHWFDTIKSPIFNEHGKVTGTVGIARETTERRQTDEALQISEERFRSVWEHSIDGMRLTDGEGRILAANEAFCRLVKLPAEKLIGQVFSVAYEGHGPDELEAYRRHFEAGTFAPRLSARLRLWNAEDLDVEVSSALVQSGQHAKALLSIFRDIGERKRAEEREAVFSKLGQRLSAAKATLEAAEILIDVADQLIGWDACSLDLYSPELDRTYHVLNRDTINGQRVECAGIHHDAPPSPRSRRAIENGGLLVLSDLPGNAVPDAVPFGDTARPSASAIYVPIRDGSKVAGVLSLHRYTPRAYDPHSLATLQALADHCGGALNRIITEETLRTAQQQLRQAQKMEAIGQLAGGVAHDFNNMLAVIRGNAELLLMDADQHSPETRECLKQVTAASERAANLTRQLLAFSRKQVMQSRPLVLNDVVADLTKMLRRIIGEHIDLQCRYAAQLPFVQADAGMVEQVLVNLAVNARDAMPHGGQLLITTELANLDAVPPPAHPEARAGQFVCLMVKDAGTGIAPEHLPRIFEPFFTTKELGKGTGLGLATVYGIVKQHQGWIEVSSQPGAGATFRIFLPAIPTPAPTSDTPKPEADLPGGTETILLVEDDFGVRMITRRVLESHGYRICDASTAAEALDLWRSRAQEITLLLTDIVMPQGVTGRDLVKQLRALRPSLKVIFMSGYSADVIGKDTHFFRRTNSSFLQKPCSARTLLETVRRCLDEK